MYADERIAKLQSHLAEHPHDYQAVIGLLKARSDAIDHEIREIRIAKLKKVAEIRREHEKSTLNGRGI